MISEDEIARILQQLVAQVDARLQLDRGAIRYLRDPYPGVEYGLRLGDAGALLFLPEADLVAPDWERRVRERLAAARRYLEGFPQHR